MHDIRRRQIGRLEAEVAVDGRHGDGGVVRSPVVQRHAYGLEFGDVRVGQLVRVHPARRWDPRVGPGDPGILGADRFAFLESMAAQVDDLSLVKRERTIPLRGFVVLDAEFDVDRA